MDSPAAGGRPVTQSCRKQKYRPKSVSPVAMTRAGAALSGDGCLSAPAISEEANTSEARDRHRPARLGRYEAARTGPPIPQARDAPHSWRGRELLRVGDKKAPEDAGAL